MTIIFHKKQHPGRDQLLARVLFFVENNEGFRCSSQLFRQNGGNPQELQLGILRVAGWIGLQRTSDLLSSQDRSAFLRG